MLAVELTNITKWDEVKGQTLEDVMEIQAKNTSSCRFVFVFQGFVSFLLPCFAVDHLYLSYDEYLFSEEETPITEGTPTCNVLIETQQ